MQVALITQPCKAAVGVSSRPTDPAPYSPHRDSGQPVTGLFSFFIVLPLALEDLPCSVVLGTVFPSSPLTPHIPRIRGLWYRSVLSNI